MKNKKLDIIGCAGGVFLVLVLIVNIIWGNAVARANQPKIPATAQTYSTSAQGIFSEVKVETVADKDGIYSVKVDASGETPDLGGKAAEELPAKILEAQSVDVDGYAGATMTSNAIKAAVTDALVQAGFMEAPAVEEPAEESAAEPAVEAAAVEVPEGASSVETSAQGIFSEVKVTTVADANTIYSVTVDASGETPELGGQAAVSVPEAIVAAQSVDVDGMAGATMTSNAIKAAVTDALRQTGFLAAEESAAEPAEEPAVEAAAAEVPEGAQTLTASAPGVFGAPVVVEVVADANGIYSVVVTENDETQGIGSNAIAELPDKIVAAQSVEIDGTTGATMTSNAIKTAVLAALTEAGIDPANFAVVELAPEAEVEKTPETLECDVVVVGAGGAGLTSAVRATQAGAKVLVLEKMPNVGGNSLRAEGGMNAAETSVQKELGLDDSTIDNYVADTLRLGHDLADPALVRTLGEGGAEAVDWLASIGAPLTKVAATGGTEHKYLHKPEDGRPVGEYLVDKLSAEAERLGIEIMVNTRATEILMENGQAVGVIAEDKAHVYTVKAKAVVLATGGFGANFELMASYDPSLADAVTTNHSGATGDGIAMAEAIGAATVDMEQIQLHPTVIQSNGLLVSESLRSHGAIIVNSEGKRFVNDMAGRDVVSQAELKQPGAYAYIIFDQALVDEVALTHKFIDGGYALSGDTYEALGQAMGLEGEAVQNFVDTMTNWEAAVAAGEDKDFGRSKVSMIDISTAPYYAIKIAPGIHHTMGGIKIDTAAEVISTEGEVIPGLFACGETTGGIHGGNRVGGNAVADFTIFGSIAGKGAARFAGFGEAEAAVEAAEPAEENAAEGGAQTLTASAPGVFNEPVVVEVVADASGIYSVVVTENHETEGIGSVAIAELPAKIVAAQSVEVDGVAGATMTSNAIKTAVLAALTEAGIDPANFAAPAAEAEVEPLTVEDKSYDVDVVVVGAGGAGMTAAITAHDAGKTVLVLESQAMVGGNSVRSTGGMNAAKTEWQDANEFGEAAGVEATLKKVANYPDNEEIQALAKIVEEQWAAYQAAPEGYFDSTELFRLDTMIGGGAMNNPILVKTLAENSEDAIAWLGELEPSVVLHNVAAFGGASVKRIHRPVDENGKTLSVGAYVVPLLKENLDKRGVEVLLSTTATAILKDDNGVCGVVAAGPNGETVTVNAKAVVIATGGFGANNDMIASIRPELDGFITTNAPGIQGQGIQMAQAIGADTVDLEQIQLHPTVHVEGPNAVLITEGLRGDGAILVNQEGLRFFDEVSTRDKVSAAEFEQTGGYAWLIVDSRMSDASNVIQGYINKGYAVSGDTYEALAEAIGAPADVFAATMADWNAKVEAKEDADFGRVSFANPLDQAPYYAIKVQPGIHHTMGGIKINENAQVIDTEGNVIAGLFAAGEVTGGVHGNNRLGGNAVADFTIFGRIAGQSAAAYAGGEAEGAAEGAEPAEENAAEGESFTASAESLLNFELCYVTIVVKDGQVVGVDVDTSSQSADYGAAAEPQFEEQILAANGGAIDGVSGATLTSMAVKEAYAEVLKMAGIG